MMKNEIYDNQFYRIDKINNFLDYLRTDFKIDASKTVKEIIFCALDYDRFGDNYTETNLSKIFNFK